MTSKAEYLGPSIDVIYEPNDLATHVMAVNQLFVIDIPLVSGFGVLENLGLEASSRDETVRLCAKESSMLIDLVAPDKDDIVPETV